MSETTPASEMGLLANFQHMEFSIDHGPGWRAAIGLVLLATDQILEYELHHVLGLPGVAIYHSRLHNAPEITPESLRAMEAGITGATSLIVPGCPLDVVAFGCTSGTMTIGEEQVFERIRSARPGVACTTPITAALAGFRALEARRIALLTPYRDDINHSLRAYIEGRGFQVPVMGSFNEGDDVTVARISPHSVEEAVMRLGQYDEVDMVFVSCTNLRLSEAVAQLEATLGKPVTSSNHAMGWHSLRLAGIDDTRTELGELFRRPLST